MNMSAHGPVVVFSLSHGDLFEISLINFPAVPDREFTFRLDGRGRNAARSLMEMQGDTKVLRSSTLDTPDEVGHPPDFDLFEWIKTGTSAGRPRCCNFYELTVGDRFSLLTGVLSTICVKIDEGHARREDDGVIAPVPAHTVCEWAEVGERPNEH